MGRHFWDRRSTKAFPKAVSYFEEAIAQDPEHARAYAGLADAYMSMGGYGQVSPRQTATRVRFAAARALEIDRNQAEAWASLAHASAFLDWNWSVAGQQFEHALRLDPDCVKARHWYSLWLMNRGQFPEAIREMESALSLEPASMIVNNNLGLVYFMARRFNDSVAQYQRTIELDTGHYVPYWGMGRALEQMNRYPEAIENLRQAASIPEGRLLVLGNLGHALGRYGSSEEARDILDELKREAGKGKVSTVWVALVQLGLGDRRAAIESLRAAAEVKSLWLAGLKVDPIFDGLRGDPRFDGLLAQMRLTDEPR